MLHCLRGDGPLGRFNFSNEDSSQRNRAYNRNKLWAYKRRQHSRLTGYVAECRTWLSKLKYKLVNYTLTA